MGYDQLNPAILRGTSERMRYIVCTRKTRKTDAHRTLKYVLIILACLTVYPESSDLLSPTPFPFRFSLSFTISRRESTLAASLTAVLWSERAPRHDSLCEYETKEHEG